MYSGVYWGFQGRFDGVLSTLFSTKKILTSAERMGRARNSSCQVQRYLPKLLYVSEIVNSEELEKGLRAQVYLPITTYPGGGPEAPLGGVPEGTTSKRHSFPVISVVLYIKCLIVLIPMSI